MEQIEVSSLYLGSLLKPVCRWNVVLYRLRTVEFAAALAPSGAATQQCWEVGAAARPAR